MRPSLALAALFVVASLGCATTPRAREAETSLAPDFELVDRAGHSVKLSSLRGRVVLVDFWASWCGPCKDAMPYYAELHGRHGADLAVLGLSVDEDPAELQKALEDHPVPFPVLHDEGGKVAQSFGVSAMPTSFLIGRDGRVALRHEGFVPSDRAVLDAALAGALGAAR